MLVDFCEYPNHTLIVLDPKIKTIISLEGNKVVGLIGE